MKVSRLQLQNFGPFYGAHSVDLSVSEAAPVVVIHGENERGKTTFTNAIRWALYQSAIDRNNAAIPTSRLLNNDAKAGGQFNVSVVVDFDHEGAHFSVERHAQADRIPSQEADFRFRRSLRKNGSFEPEGAVQHIVNSILHPEILRFFLFDGEMLNEYEDLLRDPYRKNVLVKQSIERILGLPSIQRAVNGLSELKRVAERTQMQEARSRRDNEKVIADAQQKEEALGALESDIESQKNIKQGLEGERDVLRQKMEQFGEIRADLRNLDEIENGLKQADVDSDLLRSEIKALLKEFWWVALEGTLSRQSEQTQEMAERATTTLADRERLVRLMEELKESETARRCELCRNDLTDTEIALMAQRRAEMNRTFETLPPDDVAKHFVILNQLRPFLARRSYPALREKESAIRKLTIRKRQLKASAEQIRERVRTDYRAEIGQVQRDLEKCLMQLADVDRVIRETEQRRNEADSALQRLQAQIRKLPNANKKIALQAGLYEGLREIFDATVDDFGQQLRVRVMEEATEIHRNLSAEPSYREMRINEQFGLSLVNDRGRVIQDRSAGAEQIVALSLIGALNKCATREGPIIMDTPFGRLDKRHRANILRYAPRLGPQVVLLVQSGELDRDKDLDELRPFIRREYRIERDNASDRSRIVDLAQ